LDVQSYEGFAPHAGDSFNVVTWGSAGGAFDAATGLVFGGVALDPILSDTGLTLVARTVTQQAGDGDQTLTGSTSHDNVLVGGSGNDTLIAGPGHDLLIGGKGDTTFIPGAGNDHMVGGAGTNTVDFSSQPGPVNVNLSQGTATTSTGAQDTLIGIQNINGTPYADTIVGNAHDNIIDGGGGADTLTGGGGHTTFEFDSPSQGGATITNFASGRDIIALLSSAFGLGSSITAGQNFSTIETAFNGTYAGVNAAFTASQPTLVFSTHDDALYYDPHGTGPGYSLVAHLEPGAAVAANDIHLMHGVLA
jgi:Ca2+-binding RTX toxin-like protein